jgi:hypothetical protein
MVYREVGKTMDKQSHSPIEPPKIADGKLKLGWFYGKEKLNLSSDLLNEKDLISLVQERDAAQQRLEKAAASMSRLGLG